MKKIFRMFSDNTQPGDLEMSNEILDVTIPVQCLVRDSKLVLHDRSKVILRIQNLIIVTIFLND